MLMSAGLQTVFLTVIENYMGDPALETNNAKDYSTYLYFITGYMVALHVLFCLCFRTELKRTKSDLKNAIVKNIVAVAAPSLGIKVDDTQLNSNVIRNMQIKESSGLEQVTTL